MSGKPPGFERGSPGPPQQREVPAAIANVLRGLWAEAFEMAEPRDEDDFFELGGYSMLAAQLCVRIREIFDIEFTLRSFLEAPTIAELAAKISALTGDDRGGAGAAGPRPEGRSLEDLLDQIETLSDDEVATAIADSDG